MSISIHDEKFWKKNQTKNQTKNKPTKTPPTVVILAGVLVEIAKVPEC